MSDLVQELHTERLCHAKGTQIEDLLYRAANEIEWRRERIEKLREALEMLAILGEEGMEPDFLHWLSFHDKVASVARKALGEIP